MNAEAVAESLAQAFHSTQALLPSQLGEKPRPDYGRSWDTVPRPDRERLTETFRRLLALGIVHAGSMAVDVKDSLCPRDGNPCVSTCAWYDSDLGECAVSVIAGKLCLLVDGMS